MTATEPAARVEFSDSVLELLGKVAVANRLPGSDLDRLPRRLSPSRASDFARCPQVFYYSTILGIRSPGTVATTKGTLAHAAFERIFDHPAGSRTPDLAVSYIRPAWDEMVNLDLDPDAYPVDSAERAAAVQRAEEYRAIAEPGTEQEAELLDAAETVVRSWFEMERVNNFTPTEIVMPDGSVVDGRELHVAADMFGMNMHGYIDRLDRWINPRGEAVYSVSDYKSGKAVGEGKTYSKSTMDRITYEAFFQLRVYAVLCKEMFGIDVKMLRLLYVKHGADKDKGIKTLMMTPQILANTKAEIKTIWESIMKSARTGEWKPKTGPLCNWCYYNEICPALNPQMAGIQITDSSAAG